MDVKKLGRITGFFDHRITGDRRRRRRGAGWEYVRVAIDDHSRLAYVEVLRDETAVTSAAFLRYYNHERPHGSLCERPPISRLRPDCQQRA